MGICQKGHREEAFGLRSVQRPGGRLEGEGGSQLSVKSEEALAVSGKTGMKRELKGTGNFKEGPRREWPGRASCAGQSPENILPLPLLPS